MTSLLRETKFTHH